MSEEIRRLTKLSMRCAETHTSDDIIEHLEEECLELLMAIKRVRRGREPFENFLEELIDVGIECNTVAVMLGIGKPYMEMLNKKLDKFEACLNKDDLSNGLIDRYKSIKIPKEFR